MPVKQSFLDSLEGETNSQAQTLVEAQGFVYFGVPSGTAISEIIRPNTIICWLDDQNLVNVAESGEADVVDDT